MSFRVQLAHWSTLAAGLAASPGLARAADQADKCADVYELTQSEQRSGRLLDARNDARMCAAVCPHALASDCLAWETHISAEIPSFVVHARSSDGTPVAAEVLVDGASVTPTETGTIEAEPGPHRLLLRHSGRSVDAHIELVAGVRNQLVEITIPDRPLLAPAPSSPAPPPADQQPSPSVWRWLVGGLGLATLATGGGISISGEVLADQLRGSCKPHCPQAQVDEVVQRWVIGGTVMGVGGAILLGAVLWPKPSSSPAPTARGLAINIPGRTGLVELVVAF